MHEMSTFNCKHCHAECIDTEVGYITGCEHYPVNREHLKRWYRMSLTRLHKAVSFMATGAFHNKDELAEPLLRWLADILRTMEMVKPAKQPAVQPETKTPTGNESP